MSMQVFPMAPSEERLHPEHGSGGDGHGVKHPWPDSRGHGGPTTPGPSAPSRRRPWCCTPDLAGRRGGEGTPPPPMREMRRLAARVWMDGTGISGGGRRRRGGREQRGRESEAAAGSRREGEGRRGAGTRGGERARGFRVRRCGRGLMENCPWGFFANTTALSNFFFFRWK